MKFENLREEKAVDAVIELLKEGNYKKATVKLGELRGNPADFMRLFKFLTKDTGLEDAKLHIKQVPAKVKCTSCDWRGDPEIQPNNVRCPRCLSKAVILKGNELQVTV
jgi:Zn finger protein HypA/HybF involved in hydrogenase expression